MSKEGTLVNRGQSSHGSDEDPSALAGGVSSYSGAARTQMVASLEMLKVRKIHTVTMMMGTNDVSRGDSKNLTGLPEKMSCLLQEARNYLDPKILTICTVPNNMMQDENATNLNKRVRHINDVIQEAQEKIILPLCLLDVAWIMENS